MDPRMVRATYQRQVFPSIIRTHLVKMMDAFILPEPAPYFLFDYVVMFVHGMSTAAEPVPACAHPDITIPVDPFVDFLPILRKKDGEVLIGRVRIASSGAIDLPGLFFREQFPAFRAAPDPIFTHPAPRL
jgi:hypothetical protein